MQAQLLPFVACAQGCMPPVGLLTAARRTLQSTGATGCVPDHWPGGNHSQALIFEGDHFTWGAVDLQDQGKRWRSAFLSRSGFLTCAWMSAARPVARRWASVPPMQSQLNVRLAGNFHGDMPMPSLRTGCLELRLRVCSRKTTNLPSCCQGRRRCNSQRGCW